MENLSDFLPYGKDLNWLSPWYCTSQKHYSLNQRAQSFLSIWTLNKADVGGAW